MSMGSMWDGVETVQPTSKRGSYFALGAYACTLKSCEIKGPTPNAGPAFIPAFWVHQILEPQGECIGDAIAIPADAPLPVEKTWYQGVGGKWKQTELANCRAFLNALVGFSVDDAMTRRALNACAHESNPFQGRPIIVRVTKTITKENKPFSVHSFASVGDPMDPAVFLRIVQGPAGNDVPVGAPAVAPGPAPGAPVGAYPQLGNPARGFPQGGAPMGAPGFPGTPFGTPSYPGFPAAAGAPMGFPPGSPVPSPQAAPQAVSYPAQAVPGFPAQQPSFPGFPPQQAAAPAPVPSGPPPGAVQGPDGAYYVQGPMGWVKVG